MRNLINSMNMNRVESLIWKLLWMKSSPWVTWSSCHCRDNWSSLLRKVLLRYWIRMYKSTQKRLLPCVRVLPRLMHSLKRHQDISLRGLLGAWLWNSKIFINSLQLPVKSVRCGQSVGGRAALLLLLQLQNSAVRLMRCSTPWIWQINGTFPRITGLMPLLHSVTIADCLNTPVTNVLQHVMKQRSRRPRRLVPRLLLMGAILMLAVVVVDVVVKVVVRVTILLLGANRAQMKALQTLSHIKIQPMALRREMALGWWIASPVDGMILILLGTMASGLVINLHSNFLQSLCSGVCQVLQLTQRRAHLLPLVQPHLVCPRVSWVDWLVGIDLRLTCLPPF